MSTGIFSFHSVFSNRSELSCVSDRLLWRSTGRWTWLNLLSVHPRGSTLYRFQTGQRSARKPIFKTGHPKAQGSVRSPLRSKSFMRQMGSVQPSFIRLFLDDKQAPCVQPALAARGIGLCGSATRAPGRPWMAEASGPGGRSRAPGLLSLG